MKGVMKYVSPEQYSEMTAYNGSKLGIERIKEMCQDRSIRLYKNTRRTI